MFAYRAGVLASIAAWFAEFEDMMTDELEWVVAAGAGTTDMILTSVGEDELFTQLFVHVWQGIVPTRIWMQVQDDLAGTHQTTWAINYCDTGGGAVDYWMNADQDAINLCLFDGANYDTIHAGAILPAAKGVPMSTDETYRMIAMRDTFRCRMLHYHTGVWDFYVAGTSTAEVENATIDPLDGSLPIASIIIGRNQNVGGQVKNMTSDIRAVGVNPLDTIWTNEGDNQTEWIVLREQNNINVAFRTGGADPYGEPWPDSPSLDFTSGIANSWAQFQDALRDFLAGIGWSRQGTVFRSWGDTGLATIYLRIDHNLVGLGIQAGDDYAMTNNTSIYRNAVRLIDYPVQYYITADLNFVTIAQTEAGISVLLMGGEFSQAAPNVANPFARVMAGSTRIAMGVFRCNHLYSRIAVWGTNVDARIQSSANNSSPNFFDGTTNVLWPLQLYRVGLEFLGQIPNVGFMQDPGVIPAGSTFTIGRYVYTVLDAFAGSPYALRTARVDVANLANCDMRGMGWRDDRAIRWDG